MEQIRTVNFDALREKYPSAYSAAPTEQDRNILEFTRKAYDAAEKAFFVIIGDEPLPSPPCPRSIGAAI